MDILLFDGTDTDFEFDLPEVAPDEPFDPGDPESVEETYGDDAEGQEEPAEDEASGDDDGFGEDAVEAPDMPGDEAEAAAETIEDPTEREETLPSCTGPAVGGFCWYASAVNDSCDSTCAVHGGCSLAGTRYYAGSDGTDAHCIEVLDTLGYGAYEHSVPGGNQFGCFFAWDIYTYWSPDLQTNCEDGCPGCLAHVVRMCACNE